MTSIGVSAAYWEAAILNPAFQPGIVRPARKYSSRFFDALDFARKPTVIE
jgi:hypothetical protein